MADTTADGAKGSPAPSSTGDKKVGLGLFLRQVIAEMHKVVRPTRQELITYTTVVLVFVVAVMLFVAGLDYVLNKLMGWAFGGGGL